MFGLKSRICESDDARNLGDLSKKVTPEVAFELERRVNEINANVPNFLKFAGAASFADIPAANYDILDRFLKSKEQKAK